MMKGISYRIILPLLYNNSPIQRKKHTKGGLPDFAKAADATTKEMFFALHR